MLTVIEFCKSWERLAEITCLFVDRCFACTTCVAVNFAPFSPFLSLREAPIIHVSGENFFFKGWKRGKNWKKMLACSFSNGGKKWPPHSLPTFTTYKKVIPHYMGKKGGNNKQTQSTFETVKLAVSAGKKNLINSKSFICIKSGFFCYVVVVRKSVVREILVTLAFDIVTYDIIFLLHWLFLLCRTSLFQKLT